MARVYYTLIASLPALPYFERARRLPINRERLEGRLSMLAADDRETVRLAVDFLEWQRQPFARTDAEIVARYRRITESVADPALSAMIGFRIELRTAVAALRRRHAGRPPPRPGEPWGAGRFVDHIVRHWAEPDFRLAPVFPWLSEARQKLEEEDRVGLQTLLMSVVWQHLSRLGEDPPFAFDALLVYIFKWDIVRRWLTYDEAQAAERFEQLLTEATGDHAPLFG